ncbi:MAG TPA: PAS domain S-box protein, partial [Spirochaetota bacterium]|nr:PAS domain S-box protein [Spirochaetota bacterium]
NSILFDKDFFESICIYNDKGEIQSSSPIKKRFFHYDAKSVLDKKNITFLTNNFDENGHNFKLAIYYPILKDDIFFGFILGAINFNCIESVLQPYRDKKKRINILVFDGKNNLLFTGEKGKKINAVDIVGYDNDNISNFNIVNIDGKKNIVFFEKIKEVDWNVALVSELSYAFKAAVFLRSVVVVYFILGILTTIFTMFLGYFFIFRPLVELSYQTARIAHSDYNFSFKDNLIKELNMLTQNFKRMREKIIKKETELTNSELKYRKLIEDSLDFFFKVSNKMKFTFISPSIEKTLGYTAEEFLAGFRKHLRYSKQNSEIIGISRRVFKNMEIPDPFIFEIENKFGKPVVMEIQLTPVVFNNEVAELQGSARDITLRYNVEKEIS